MRCHIIIFSFIVALITLLTVSLIIFTRSNAYNYDLRQNCETQPESMESNNTYSSVTNDVDVLESVKPETQGESSGISGGLGTVVFRREGTVEEVDETNQSVTVRFDEGDYKYSGKVQNIDFSTDSNNRANQLSSLLVGDRVCFTFFDYLRAPGKGLCGVSIRAL